jgi:hypothetical protein
MHDLKVTNFHQADLEDIISPEECLLWSGQPSYGRRFFQAIGDERVIHTGLLIGVAVMWSSLYFIGPEAPFGRKTAVWAFSGFTIMFVAVSFFVASMRHYVLNSLVYLVTDRRAIICRRGRNWRLSTRLYVVSCPHSETYPYSVIPSRPYPSLQVGTMLSESQVQPFWLGLSHPGQPVLWGRVTAPVVFEYVPNAQELLEIIRSCARVQTVRADQ